MLKRSIDIFLALLGLVVFSPLLLLLWVMIRVKLGSPVLFRQERPGLHGRVFKMLKFRSMTDARGPDGQLLDDSVRLTSFGRRLRSTSMDELPGLWCVLKGDMSIVGPRPLLVEYLPLYSPEQARRHDVRPGITGWAQVNGRNALSWEDKFAHDLWYVDNANTLLDLKIIAMTFAKVFKREGVAAEGQATMTKFEGTRR